MAKYETIAGMPSRSVTFSRMTDSLRQLQEDAATMAHLCRDDDALQAQGWLAVSEMFKLTIINIVKLATKGRIN